MNWLKRARKAKSLTAKELASAAGVSLNYVQRIEGGSRPCPADLLAKFEDALGFTQDEVSFDYEGLIQKANDFIQEKGNEASCHLSYVFIDERIIFTDISLEGEGLKTSLECGKWLLEFQQWALD